VLGALGEGELHENVAGSDFDSCMDGSAHT